MFRYTLKSPAGRCGFPRPPQAAPPQYPDPYYVLRSAVYILRSAVHVLRSAVYVLRSAVHVLRPAVYVLRSAVHVLRSAVHVLRPAVYVLRRVLDPLNDGGLVTVPFVAEYEYRGIEQYQGIPVHRIFAKYALRYRYGENAGSTNSGEAGGILGTELNFGSLGGQGQSTIFGQNPSDRYGLPGDSGLSEQSWLSEGQSFIGCQGSHDVAILLRVSDGLPLMTRDILDDTFSWPDGRTVRFRGFTLIFCDGFMPLNRDTTVAALDNNFTNGIEASSVPEGIRLTIKDIRFVLDSDELLPAEQSRLDTLAAALKQVPGRNFLVEGHTAAVRRPTGERELSVRRAKRMVNELVKRGMSEDRFMYKGWGGTKPVGNNETEAGRGQNRRVEITILE